MFVNYIKMVMFLCVYVLLLIVGIYVMVLNLGNWVMGYVIVNKNKFWCVCKMFVVNDWMKWDWFDVDFWWFFIYV